MLVIMDIAIFSTQEDPCYFFVFVYLSDGFLQFEVVINYLVGIWNVMYKGLHAYNYLHNPLRNSPTILI